MRIVRVTHLLVPDGGEHIALCRVGEYWLEYQKFL